MSRRKQVIPDEIPDEVANATAAVRRSVGRLVKLLGHEDDLVLEATGQALRALGPDATVNPLADALPRAASPRHRVAIVLLLRDAGPGHRDRVYLALLAARKRERDLRVLAQIQASLIALTFAPVGPTTPPAASLKAGKAADPPR